ncbi:MAG TPA: hypothetical protein DEQ30_01150 [Porphyromonadaceae bacterium]|nr:hypothetical protein [Porphyromonadaceae bacterium]
MKTINLFRILFAFISVMMLSPACNDDLIKDDIDADNSGDKSKLPVMTISSPGNVTYESADITASWNNTGDEIIEAGFVYSLNESFIPTEVVTVKKISGSSMDTTLSLSSETNYFIKAYAQTQNNGIAYSDPVNITTPVAPVFEHTYLFGKYTATDIDVNTGEPEGDSYEVTISQRGTSYNKINIANIWGGGRTIEATVDFEKKTISVATTSVIHIDSTHGNVYMWGFDIQDNKIVYLDVAIANYDDNGNIEFTQWAAHVSAGNFGYYTTTMKKEQ